jgi:hypothetical protein
MLRFLVYLIHPLPLLGYEHPIAYMVPRTQTEFLVVLRGAENSLIPCDFRPIMHESTICHHAFLILKFPCCIGIHLMDHNINISIWIVLIFHDAGTPHAFGRMHPQQTIDSGAELILEKCYKSDHGQTFAAVNLNGQRSTILVFLIINLALT